MVRKGMVYVSVFRSLLFLFLFLFLSLCIKFPFSICLSTTFLTFTINDSLSQTTISYTKWQKKMAGGDGKVAEGEKGKERTRTEERRKKKQSNCS